MTRLRDLGLAIGRLPTGPTNSIADVDGVSVGHATVDHDGPRVARTGVTVVHTRPPGRRGMLCPGAMYSLNGNGEFTGSHWLAESGLLAGPVAITNTHQVGLVRDELVRWQVDRNPATQWCLPVVGETYDGFLNDIDAFHLEASHVRAALVDADRPRLPGEPRVVEGCVGGGTGMVCHQFKGGIGTSSRRAGEPGSADGEFTVGALVQANYGRRALLRLDGARIGHLVGEDVVPLPSEPHVPEAGSVIVLVATDAPLVADQCRRLAQRATIGLARVGSIAADSSGDIVLAWSAGNEVPEDAASAVTVRSLPHDHLTPLFEAVAEAVEEAVWNALVAATTMIGQRGRTVHAIPHDVLRRAAALASPSDF
ncbi:MAG: hypothetical protein RJB61_1881 [Actinomycetota bacterium]